MRTGKIYLIIILLLLIAPAFGQSADSPFAPDVKAFVDNDKINPPPQHAIVFAGSSSFTLWKDVQSYFPGYTIVNRAFGGSTLLDQMRYLQQVIVPCHPEQIVLYCGENDFAYSDTLSVRTVVDRFKTLFTLIRSEFPGVYITYVSMKPSPSRWKMAPKFEAANTQIRRFLRKQHHTGFVDIWNKMLDKNHLPNRSLFLDDMLHMNATGYKIWQHAILPKLKK